MSAGNNFIRVCIEEQAKKIFRRVSDDYFLEEELGAYNYSKAHLQQYHALPSLEIMEAEGHPLPLINGQSAGVEYYLQLLRRRYAYTKVNDRHPELKENLKTMNMEGMMSTLRHMLGDASASLEVDNFRTLAEELVEVKEGYEFAKSNPGLRGVTFGWDTLDKVTSGAQAGDLIAIAGRANLGKSWLMIYVAYCAWLSGKSVCFTSMEMTLSQIARRFLGLHMRVNPNFIRDGELSFMSESRMMQVIEDISQLIPLHLMAGDMTGSVAGVETMIEEFDPDIAMVDSAYLLNPSARKKGYASRWESISDTVNELKILALSRDIPLIGSFQFNRNQKSKGNKEMDLRDIGGSDTIPQAASIVLGIQEGPPPFQDSQRLVDIMKNREGDTPKFATAFTFSPVNFKEVPLVINDAEVVENDFDGSWME